MKIEMTHNKPTKDGLYLVQFQDSYPYTVEVKFMPEDRKFRVFHIDDSVWDSWLDVYDSDYRWSEIIEID